jgi:hypothetical protein
MGEFAFEVDVVQLQAAQLGDPDAGVEQQPQDRLVPTSEEDRAGEDAGPPAADRMPSAAR